MRRELPADGAAQPVPLLWRVSVMPASAPIYFFSFNCLGGKQRKFDFIISLGLLCSAVGHLNGIIVSGDNGLGEGR